MISYLTNFLEKEKNRKIIKGVFYAAITVIYLFIALHFIYKLGTYLAQDIIFSSDSVRVYKDWTIFDSNHYRTKVHPLYVIFVFPFIKIFSFIFQNNAVTIAFVTAVVGVLNVWLLNSILDKLTKNKESLFVFVIKAIVIVFFALSFTQLENLTVVESFGIGTLTLLLFWNYLLTLLNKDLKLRHYAILVFLGILTISMVITNFFHFVIGTFCLFMFNKKKNFEEFFGDFLVFVLLNAIVLVFSYHLCNLQMKIFPQSQNSFDYFINVVKDFITGTESTEETKYIEFNGLESIINVIKFFFVYTFFGYKVETKWTYYMNFRNFGILNFAYLIVIVALVVLALYFIIKNKLFVAVPFVLTTGFECILHSFYGNTSLILFVLKFAILLSILLFLGLSNVKHQKLQLLVCSAFAALVTITFIFNILSLKTIHNIVLEFHVPPITNFWAMFFLSLLQIAIVVFAVVTIKTFIKNHRIQKESKETNDAESKKCKILDSIKNLFIALKNKINAKRFFALCVAVVSILTIGLEVVTLHGYKRVNNKVTAEYESSKIYIDREAEITTNYTVIFGMGRRNKFMIKKETPYLGGAKIYKFWPGSTYKQEICRNLTLLEYDSVNYTAKLKNENTKEIVYLIENENGIYLKCGDKNTPLDETQHINIPTFEEYEYPELMRAYFGEMMVNITQKGVVFSVLNGGNYWYRHTAMVAMALEKTGNLSQILPMINSITPATIYDYARNGNTAKDSVKHIDNLGEVLYLMSLLDAPKQDVVDAVLAEAKKYEKNNPNVTGKKYIEALTDGYAYPSYQTKWLKFGMDSLGLDSSAYDVTGLTDWLTSTAWFYDRSTRSSISSWCDIEQETEDMFNQCVSDANSKFAMFHRYNTKIEIPDEIVYPMSHYGKLGNKDFTITHSLTAAEGLLYLYDYKDYT